MVLDEEVEEHAVHDRASARRVWNSVSRQEDHL